MSEKLTPNTAQQRLIDETEGIYHVDAGAGTGKTFAITRRYANIVDQPDVEPDTNKFLHIRLFTTHATALTETFLRELREKHDVDDAVFLVDDADRLKTALQRHGLDFRYELHGNRNSIERVFREVKR